MKITPEQIDRLYQFTIQHYVEYYDLQTELVDHLANAIEEQWQENPKMSFEDALQVEFKKFGIFGFTDLVEKRRFALQTKYQKIALEHLNQFFKLPKIILTLALIAFFGLYVNENQKIFAAIILYITFFVLHIYHWVSRKSKRKSDDKKWLFEEVLRNHNPISYFGLMWLISLFAGFFRELVSLEAQNTVKSFYFGACVVYIGLVIYVTKIIIPMKIKEYLKETYPEYEISR